MDYAFIGGGNMGRALASSLVGKGVCLGEDILVVDPDEQARAKIADLDCLTAPAVSPDVGNAPTLLLAVKPQSAGEMFSQLKPFLKKGQTVVSIMAGTTISAIQKGLGHDAVVRVMPNTPAQVGLGMNVYYAAPGVTAVQLDAVEALFKASGETLAVSSEDAIDAATAISGSGPAYVFYMAEYWMKAAQALGFDKEEAGQLVQQTLIGATALWKHSGEAPATLREQVTSKGGTTAAAMEFFEKNKVGKHFEGGIQRAYKRAKELGKKA